VGLVALLSRLRPAAGDRQRLGRRGERAAARHLRRRRYRIIGRNVRLPAGEVDLVALAPDRCTIVIVEVKTREQEDAGRGIPPEASVTRAKQQTLLKLTELLVARNHWEDRPVRIDVISVHWSDDGARIEHFEDAVRALTTSSGARRASRGRRTRA
jgi:putative endonuclease